MKKIALFLISCISFSVTYLPIEVLQKNLDKVKPGDIILLKPTDKSIISIFGHIAFVNKYNKVVDFKAYGSGFFESPLWLFADIPGREYTILRYKEMTDEFLENIEKDMPNWYDKQYDVMTPLSGNDETTYCSQFVMQVYEDAARKTYNKEVKFSSTNELILLPEKFLEAGVYDEIVFE